MILKTINYIIILLVLFSSCQKEEVLTTFHQTEKPKFNQSIENSTWVLREIEFQNNISYYNDTLKFLKDTTLIYNFDTTSYEWYPTSSESYELRLKDSPVGYIDTDLTSNDLSFGELTKHPFYNVFALSNKYKITLNRLK
jgi:hypothetical protein